MDEHDCRLYWTITTLTHIFSCPIIICVQNSILIIIEYPSCQSARAASSIPFLLSIFMKRNRKCLIRHATVIQSRRHFIKRLVFRAIFLGAAGCLWACCYAADGCWTPAEILTGVLSDVVIIAGKVHSNMAE